MTPIVDLYLRKSNKDEGRSVSRQLAELTDAAADEGLRVGRVFVDPDFSASRYRRRERPDYAALLDHIRAGDCRVLGILEASRGSRDLTEWSTLLDLCRKLDVRIWIRTHDRVYDLSRRRDWRALADEGLDAADESEKISERTRSGKRKAAREGRPPGRLAYGFTRTYDSTGRFVAQLPHPDQAPVVAEMVRRVASGEALFSIAADLNARGITMSGGSPWAGRLVRQTVLRPAYAGRRVHRGEDVGTAAWAPIVDVDQWRRAVAVLTRPERRSTTRGTALTHWLTGAVACGRCHRGRLVAKTQGASGRPMRYACGSCGKLFVAGRPLEEFVEAVVLRRLARPDALAVFQARADDTAVKRAADTIAALRKRLDEHYDEAAKGKLSARGLTVVEGRILAEIGEVEAKAQRLALPPLLADTDPADVIARWSQFSPAMKRAYVTTLAELVVAPAARRGPGFDSSRLAPSRWVGVSVTWGEMWAEED